MNLSRLNKEGEVHRIVWNNMMRDSFVSKVPLDLVKPMYHAMKLYHDLMYDPKNMITIKLSPGKQGLLNYTGSDYPSKW